MSNLNVFHNYNLCLSFSGLVSSPSPPVLVSVLSFHVLFHPRHITVSASVLLFHSQFHLPVLQFQLLFSLLTTASPSDFLSFVLYSFAWWFFFPLSIFVSAFFMLWCGWLLHYIYFLNHFCWGVEFVTTGLFNWSTASFGDFLGWESPKIGYVHYPHRDLVWLSIWLQYLCVLWYQFLMSLF